VKKCPFCAEDIQDAAILCKHCGRDLSAGPPAAIDSNSALQAELKRLTDAGKKIEAIKRLREATGMGLAEAKNVVEAIQQRRPAVIPPASAAPLTAKSTNPVAVGCGLILVLVVGFIVVAMFKSSDTDNTGSPSSTVNLVASVRFTGTQFTVKNESTSQAWTDVTCTLNPSGLMQSGFDFRVASLAPGEEVTVGALQFAKSDGTRFNPFEMKAMTMTIVAKVDGRLGVYSAKWE
jgi:ribosomal protein L7/L12